MRVLRRLLFIVLLAIPVGSQAVIPALVALLTYYTADAAFVTALGASAVTVGAAVGFVHFKDPSAAQPVITVQLAPLAKAETPTGWTPPAAGVSQPTPPSTGAAPVTTYTWTASPTLAAPSDNPDTECANIAAAVVGSCQAGITGAGRTGNTCNYTSTNCGAFSIGMTAAVSCSAGYTVSGATCVLSNAAIVMKPDTEQKCAFIRVGNVWTVDTRDKGCQSMPAGVNYSNNAITVVQSDGKVSELAIDPSTGRSTVTTTTPNGDGTSTRSVQALSSPSNGGGDGSSVLVTGTNTGTYTGAGTGATPPPGTTTAACGAAGQPACNMTINEAGTPTDTALTAANTHLDTAATARGTAITNMNGSAKVSDLGLSMSVDWPSASCENPSFDVKGHTMLVKLCEKSSDIKSMVDFIFAILCAWALFNIGTGALRPR